MARREASNLESVDPREPRPRLPIPDLLEFADWAFGSNGIATLRVLAYGDFSCEDRYEEQQIIFIKSECHFPLTASYPSTKQTPYKVLMRPYRFWKQMADVYDTITACPLENLMDDRDTLWSM